MGMAEEIQGRDTGVCFPGRWEDTVPLKDTFVVDTSNSATVHQHSHDRTFTNLL